MRPVWLTGGGLSVVAIGAIAWFVWYPTVGAVLSLDHRDSAKVKAGAEIYATHCASCHGVNLEGQPNWREPLPEGGLPAPPHNDDGHTWHHEDQVLFDYTKLGGQALLGSNYKSHMPGFGDSLSDDEIWAVLSYIKSTWSERIQDIHDQRNASVASE